MSFLDLLDMYMLVIEKTTSAASKLGFITLNSSNEGIDMEIARVYIVYVNLFEIEA